MSYNLPKIDLQWAFDHNTDLAVATAIHAIADSKRSPDAIWEAPTPAEWDNVAMAVEQYVIHGDFACDPSGYCWGEATLRI